MDQNKIIGTQIISVGNKWCVQIKLDNKQEWIFKWCYDSKDKAELVIGRLRVGYSEQDWKFADADQMNNWIRYRKSWTYEVLESIKRPGSFLIDQIKNTTTF